MNRVSWGGAETAGARIELAGVPSGESAAGSVDLEVSISAGLHAIVGTADDGLLALAPLVAGVVRSRRGRVRVAGLDPYRHPELRARIGATFATPVLPERRVLEGLLRART